VIETRKQVEYVIFRKVNIPSKGEGFTDQEFQFRKKGITGSDLMNHGKLWVAEGKGKAGDTMRLRGMNVALGVLSPI